MVAPNTWQTDYIKNQDWSNPEQATKNVYGLKQNSGLDDDGIASAMNGAMGTNWTGADIGSHFAKFGQTTGQQQAATADSEAAARAASPPAAPSYSGFSGIQGNGTQPAPAPAGMVGPIGAAPTPGPAGAPGAAPPAANKGAFTQQLRAMNWTGDPAGATKQAWGLMQTHGLDANRVAEELDNGLTGAQITSHLTQHGYNPATLPQSTASSQQIPGGAQGENGSILNSAVDYRNETIEGRVANLLAHDANGNYTHPSVRQAVDRQMQSFAARGLINSSMAQQAGQEAAIAKAIEIAGPDAQTYFQNRRANIGENNKVAADGTAYQRDQVQREQAFQRDQIQQQQQRDFTTRGDYQKAVQTIDTNYQRQIDTINASNMTPEDKSVAIAQATAQRDSTVTYQNNIFARMPGWQAEWLAQAAPSNGIDFATVDSLDYLENVINDPAQSQAARDAARARRDELRASGAANPPPPAPKSDGMVGGNLYV